MTLTPDDCAKLRRLLQAANLLHSSAVEFVNDWHKGDFKLCFLAACDVQSISERCEQYRHEADLLVPLIERLLKKEE